MSAESTIPSTEQTSDAASASGSDASPASLSISIVSYYSPVEELKTTVSSLAGALRVLRKESSNEATNGTSNDASATANSKSVGSINVILIDNSESASVTAEEFTSLQGLLSQVPANLTLIQGNGNVGYGAAHNLAILSSRSEFHLILNPDVTLAPDCLSAGLQFLNDNADVVLVSPKAHGPNGERQFLCKRYPSAILLLLRGFFPWAIKALFPRRNAEYEMRDLSDLEPSKDIPIAIGCFMLCRREALATIRGFDPNYFLYFEDFDLSLRLAEQGTLAFLPAMQIVHGGGNAAKKGLRHIRLFMASGRRFFNRWGWRWL